MKITIRMNAGTENEETKQFSTPFVSARKLKNTVKMSSLIGNDKDEAMIDAMTDYIVDIFGKQFTVDELLDGVSSQELVDYFVSCVTEVAGRLEMKMGALKDPNG